MTRYLVLFSIMLLLLVGLAGCRQEPAPTPEAPLATVAPTTEAPPATATTIPATNTPAATATPEATPTLAPTATATAMAEVEPSPTATAEAVAPTATPVPTLEPVEGEPTEIVRAFLDSFLREDPETEQVRYLDAGLRAQVAEGETIAGLLGVSERYRSFSLNLIDDGSRDGEATVRAALSYVEPVYLSFEVTLHENDSWYISAIEPAQPPAGAGDPGEVVNEFLTSLLYDRSGSSSLIYLTAGLQQEVAGGRSVLDLLGVSSVYGTYSYAIINDGSRTGTALVEATLDYASGPVIVTFSLVEEAGSWRISRIRSG